MSKWDEQRAIENAKDSRRRRVRGNPNKIKEQFIPYWEPPVYRCWGWTGGYWVEDTICYHFRSVRTNQERKWNKAHCEEYGEHLVRGRRRTIPDAWEDLPNASWGHRHSWKKHSRRKYQWKPKAV